MLAVFMWVFIAWVVLSILLLVGKVGKETQPITPRGAVIAVGIWGAFLGFVLIPAALTLSA